MLAVKGMSVRRGHKTLVESVDFQSMPGSFTAIIGPNGAGKSSVFKGLSGEWPTESGTIEIGGKIRSTWKRKDLAQHMAVMGQMPTLHFDFTVRELVQLGRAPYRGLYSQATEDAVIDEALRQADLTAFAERSAMSLSGGERQRAFFAKTLVQLMAGSCDMPGGGRLLLLDEPTSALDLGQQAQLMRSLKHIVDAGGCVVAILHDLNLASAFADQIVMIKNGRVFAQGSPAEVITKKRTSDCYECDIAMFTQSHQQPFVSLAV